MAKYILNAFSLNMLSESATVQATELFLNEAQFLADGAESAVGHADTAAVFSSVLKRPVECRRTTVSLSKGDNALVGQYSGPRLPEGATTLPEGATIKWFLVVIE